MIFRDDKGIYQKEQVGIYKDLDPFGVEKSKENRFDERLEVDKLGNQPLLAKANNAYNQKKYDVAFEIWEALHNETHSDEAAYRLGYMYFYGVGVPKDLIKAYNYWKQGAEDGGEKSLYQLEVFRSKLTDQQLLEFEQKTL